MTTSNEAMSAKVRAQAVYQRLAATYGDCPRQARLDPIAELVSTILSQNTNDLLRDQAYHTLRTRFPTWEQVRDAPVQEVQDAIRIAGLSQQKAPRMQEALRHITAVRGKLELEFLRDLPVEDAKAWLTAMNGVGPKTAAIILLFALNRPAFPVDTHIHRVTRRLGLIPLNTSREKAHDLLEDLLPPETYYSFHLNLIRHGREVCAARKPQCAECTLGDLCDYPQAIGAGSTAGQRTRGSPRSDALGTV